MFLKIAWPGEKPEDGICRAIYEIKPVEMPYKSVPSSQLTQNFCAFFLSSWFSASNSMLIKIQPDTTVCRYLFTAKSLYMFRVSQHPSSGVLKTVTAATGTGHNTGTDTSLQHG